MEQPRPFNVDVADCGVQVDLAQPNNGNPSPKPGLVSNPRSSRAYSAPRRRSRERASMQDHVEWRFRSASDPRKAACLDYLGKFHLSGEPANLSAARAIAGKVVISRQLRRKQVIDFLSKIPP